MIADLRDPSRLKVTSFERKYVGTGVYRCGVVRCHHAGLLPRSNQGRKYTCSAHSCVMRSGDPVDDYVENAVLERLSRPDANLLIAKPGWTWASCRTSAPGG